VQTELDQTTRVRDELQVEKNSLTEQIQSVGICPLCLFFSPSSFFFHALSSFPYTVHPVFPRRL
jgi:hypothetical protein